MSRPNPIANALFPFLALAFACALAACTAGTDTTLPDPISDTGITDTGDEAITDPSDDPVADTGDQIDTGIDGDQGGEDAADAADTADTPSLEPRCNGRAVETYDEGNSQWKESEVCERTERCVDGACEDLPDGFAEACTDGACASDELTCIDDLCVSHEAGDEGTECWGDAECLSNLLCARRGFCQDGDVGDLCLDDDDCALDLAPYCSPDGACQLGAAGDGCADDLDCADDLYCADAVSECRDGSTGDHCDATDDCVDVDNICTGDPAVCTPRVKDDPCAAEDECPGELYCAGDVCQDGAEDDFCNLTSDCDEVDNICKGPPAICQPRAAFDACTDDDDECPDDLYCANSLCQDGSTSHFCDTTEDCDEPSDVCTGDPGVCTSSAKGDDCTGDEECPGEVLYCSNDICQDGASGDFCDETADCLEADDICRGDPGRCLNRVEPEECAGDNECPAADGLYCASNEGVCRDGSSGDQCDLTADCDVLEDTCKGTPLICDTRVLGDPCVSDDAECPGDIYCANLLCQDGTTGQFCDLTADCDEDNDICKGSPAICQDRVEPDACAGDNECPDGLYCASNDGKCRDGSHGDPCDLEADCDVLTDTCKGDTPVCATRIAGDECSESDDECPGAMYCTEELCWDGSTGDPCRTTDDCKETWDVCDQTTSDCRNRDEADACDGNTQCPDGWYCPTSVDQCRDGSTGDECDDTADCDEADDICRDDGDGFLCVDRLLGDACTIDDECPGAMHCSNDHCAPSLAVDGGLMDFAYIPAGSFWMGSPDGDCPEGYPGDCIVEPGRQSEELLHEVTLTRPFFLAQTEVTRGQWSEQCTEDPSWGTCTSSDCPVNSINWWEAIAYVNALSVSEGLDPCYVLEGCDSSVPGTDIECSHVTVLAPNQNPFLCLGYRLATEAEWEYAYRAETTTTFHNGAIDGAKLACETPSDLETIAWYCANAEGATHSVEGKASNVWNLFDMSGNVTEWVWDLYGGYGYPPVAQTDPLGSDGEFSDNRVYRGGGRYSDAQNCRAARRDNAGPSVINAQRGFRPARTVWPGHCYDDVVNADESDVDCGGSCRPCPPGTVTSAVSFGSDELDYVYGMAADWAGNVYVTGQFKGDLTIGGDTWAHQGNGDIYIASFASDGEYRWSHAYGNTSTDEGRGVAVAGDGTVHLVGRCKGTIDFGDASRACPGDGGAFWVSYTSGGDVIASRVYGASGARAVAYGIAIDSSNNVVITGDFSDGPVNFGGDDLVWAGSSDVFVASFTSSGTHSWSRCFGGSGSDRGQSIAVDGDGNVYVTGYFEETMNVGGVSDLGAVGAYDVFVTSYTSANGYRWAHAFGDTGYDEGKAIAVTGGEALVAGHFYGSVFAGEYELTSAGGADIFLAGFDAATGDQERAAQYGGTGGDTAYAMVRDAAGNIYVGGGFEDTVSFGGEDLIEAGSTDAYVAAFDSNLVHLWSKAFSNGLSTDRVYALSVNDSARVYAGAIFGETVDYGSFSLTSVGSFDVAVLGFD